MAKTTPPKQGHSSTTPHANRCGAKTRSGKPCKQRPIKGGKRCRMHGGSEPHARRAASANVLEAKVRGQLTRMDVTPADNPTQQLARIVGEQVAFLDLARAKLAEVTDSWTRANPITGAEEVRAAVTVYERAIDRAHKGLADMVRLGIQDRIAAANQLTAQTYAAALANMIHLARNTNDPPEQIVLAAIGEDQ